MIMDVWFAPINIIIKGPKATLGSELNMVRNGSIISARVGNSYKMMAHPKPKEIPRVNERNIS